MADNLNKKSGSSRGKFIERNRKVARKLGNIFALFFCGLLLFGLISSVFELIGGLFSEFINPERLKLIIFVFSFIFIAYVICGFLFGFRFEDDD